MERLKEYLQDRKINYAECPEGDICNCRKDGQKMYVRAYSDGTYEWSANANRNDINLPEYTKREQYLADQVFKRIEEFISYTLVRKSNKPRTE